MSREEFHLECYGLSMCMSGPASKPGASEQGAMMASFRFNLDIEGLFPYINAIADRSELYKEPAFIKFRLDDHYCVLYPRYGLATPFNDRSEALSFMERLVNFLTEVKSSSETIEPNYKLFRKISVLDILKLLPGTNCRDCGLPSCLAFAARLSVKQIRPEICPFLEKPIAEQAVFPVYDKDGELRSTVTIDIDFKRTSSEILENPVPTEQREEETEELSPPETHEAVYMPTPLTGREQEVLRMLAKGETNRQIAGRLRISPHTVKSHVIHIFNKLGVNDRTQAAVWATRRNLV